MFWFNGLLIASDGRDEPRRVSLEVMLRGTCDRARLLDLVENFRLSSEHKAGLVKTIGQNHQFLGVNKAITSVLAARKLGHGRGGVFWLMARSSFLQELKGFSFDGEMEEAAMQFYTASSSMA